MFMLPRFDRRLVQHPPHGAAADLFAQHRFGFDAPGRQAIDGSGALRSLRSFRTPSLGSTLDPEGEKAGLRPRPAWSSMEKSPAAQRLRHRCTCRADKPTSLAASVVSHVGLLMKQQYQPKALHDLDRHGSAADGVQGHLHKIVGESTRSGAWSWHSGVLSVPGFFWEFISFYKKSAVTATLFVKRTT